jgi:hypothetical protein
MGQNLFLFRQKLLFFHTNVTGWTGNDGCGSWQLATSISMVACPSKIQSPTLLSWRLVTMDVAGAAKNPILADSRNFAKPKCFP